MQFYIARVRGEQKVPCWPGKPEAAVTIVISPTFSPVPVWSMKDRLLGAEECGERRVGRLPDSALSATPPRKIHSATLVAEPFAFSMWKLLQQNMLSRQPCWGLSFPPSASILGTGEKNGRSYYMGSWSQHSSGSPSGQSCSSVFSVGMSWFTFLSIKRRREQMNPTTSCLACWSESHTRTLLRTKDRNSRPANCFSRCLSSSSGGEKWNGVIALSEATLFHHTGHLHRLEALVWPLSTSQPTSITLPWWSELVLCVSSHYTCDAKTGLMTQAMQSSVSLEHSPLCTNIL